MPDILVPILEMWVVDYFFFLYWSSTISRWVSWNSFTAWIWECCSLCHVSTLFTKVFNLQPGCLQTPSCPGLTANTTKGGDGMYGWLCYTNSAVLQGTAEWCVFMLKGRKRPNPSHIQKNKDLSWFNLS